MDIISFAKASAGGDIKLKTINGNNLKGEGNININTYQAFPTAWEDYTESNKTTKQFCDVIDADTNAAIGMGYFGGAKFSDKPSGLSNFDIVVEILAGPKQNGAATKAIHLIGTSSTIYPYRWEYTYWSHGSVSGWRGVQPEITVNPQLSGNEVNITSLQFGNTVYSVGKFYRHDVLLDVNHLIISIILPFSDSIENHHSSMANGVVGVLKQQNSSILQGIGYIYWNVDEWALYDATNTEIFSKTTCNDTVSELV